MIVVKQVAVYNNVEESHGFYRMVGDLFLLSNVSL